MILVFSLFQIASGFTNACILLLLALRGLLFVLSIFGIVLFMVAMPLAIFVAASAMLLERASLVCSFST